MRAQVEHSGRARATASRKSVSKADQQRTARAPTTQRWSIVCAAGVLCFTACSASRQPIGTGRGPNVSQAPPPTDRGPRAPPAARVIEQRNPSSPIVTIRVLFTSGSADDPTDQYGATNLLARWMIEGGTQSLTYEQMTRRLFPMAGRIAYQIDRENTVFVAQVHRDHLDAFYPLLRETILSPRLANDDLRRLRQIALSELTQELRGANDEALSREYLQAMIYPNHPYGHPPVGTERGLAAITSESLRAHAARVFCRRRLIVGLGGGYPEPFARTIAADLGALADACPDRAPLPAPAQPHGVEVAIIDRPQAASTAIAFGAPVDVTRTHADFAAMQFFTNALGIHRQSSGILYQLIREARGLNYGDYAYAEHFEQEGSTRFVRPNLLRSQQYASVWIRPVQPPNAHFALRAAVRALRRTLETGIPQDDFDRLQSFFSGYVNLFLANDSIRVGYALDDALGGFSRSYPDRMRSAWRALTRDGAFGSARRHLSSSRLFVAIVAPNASDLRDAIAANGASPIRYDTPRAPDVLTEDREISAERLAVDDHNVRVVALAEVFR